MKKLNDNNKGFSIVELVACVVLLAIVVTPLMSAFTRSTDYYDKSRRKGEATAVAQNIRETVEAMSVNDILSSGGDFSQTDFAKSLKAEKSFRNGNTVFMKGLTSVSGNSADERSLYDAVITFDDGSDAGDEDLIKKINAKEIVKDFKSDSKLNEFVQGRTNEIGNDSHGYSPSRDPDVITRSEDPVERRRLILIDIRTKEKANGEVTVKTKISYQYHNYDSCRGYYWNENTAFDKSQDSCTVHEFKLNDITLKSYEEGYTLRMSYYPFFENESENDTILVLVDAFKPEEGTNDKVSNDNEDSKLLRFNLQLIKMTPVIEAEDGVWKSVDNTTKDEIVPGSIDDHDFAEADQNYTLSLYSYYSANKTLNSILNADNGKYKTPVFSNAQSRCFGGEYGTDNTLDFKLFYFGLNDTHPRRYDERPVLGDEFISSENTNNSILKKEADDRMYSVTVDVYASGHFAYDGDGNYVIDGDGNATVNASHKDDAGNVKSDDKCLLCHFDSAKLN